MVTAKLAHALWPSANHNGVLIFNDASAIIKYLRCSSDGNISHSLLQPSLCAGKDLLCMFNVSQTGCNIVCNLGPVGNITLHFNVLLIGPKKYAPQIYYAEAQLKHLLWNCSQMNAT